MMRKAFAGFVVLLALAFAATPSRAHFQLLYSPIVNLDRVADLTFKLIFWHPFDNGHVMDMGEPEEFYYVHKGKSVDLKPALKPIRFSGIENAAQAYEATTKIKRNGDYIFVLTPAPYYEESEDLYIQQVTKSFVNKGGIPTGWHEPLGLPVEIVPMNKPTNVLAGSTFTGRVLSEGKPVAGIEVEVEYLTAEPDMATDKPRAALISPPPGGALVAITDADGYFTFGVPKAGFWGFAALGAGPKTTHNGKELSHDAVLWVRAHEVK